MNIPWLAIALFLLSLPGLMGGEPAGDRGVTILAGPDDFGYTALDDNAGACPFQWVDISASGTEVVFTPSTAEPAADEGYAAIALNQDFVFYGDPVAQLVMSSNGYLAFGADATSEDGGDFSNDCALPAIPGNLLANNARVMALHDDLTGETGPGTAYQQFFNECPRPSSNGGTEPCTILQWQDWAVHGNPDLFSFQTILYHQSNQISVQIDPPPSVDGSTASQGIQNSSANAGLAYACNDVNSLSGPTAVCYFEPDHPGTTIATDLEVILTSPQEFVVPGNVARFNVTISNFGATEVNLANISLPLPSGTTAASWTCQPDRGGLCAFNQGQGALEQVVTLAPGGSLTFNMRFDVRIDPAAPIAAIASVATPPLFSDSDTLDNSAMLALPICPFPKAYWPAVTGWPGPTTVLTLVPLLPDCSD